MAKATWNGVTLAESDEVAHVEGNAYFPMESVNWDHMKANDGVGNITPTGMSQTERDIRYGFFRRQHTNSNIQFIIVHTIQIRILVYHNLRLMQSYI